MNNKIKRLTSIVLLTIILTSVFLPSNIAFANTANNMSSKMISFFQGQYNDLDMKKLSEDELRVYSVFLSNFYTPGQTRMKDLTSDDGISEKISKVFFGNSSNSNKVKELNEIVYTGIEKSVLQGKLYNKNGDTLDGAKLLEAMTSEGEDQVLFTSGKKAVIDLGEKSFRAMMKVLASHSAAFMFDEEYGVVNMESLYLDAFGNIWGSYLVDKQVGEVTEQQETSRDNLHLVIPAAMNPLSFMTAVKYNSLSETKFPMHNAFAMGALIETETIKEDFEQDNFVPYFNVPNYFSDEDRSKSLYVYGINSPFDIPLETDKYIENENLNESPVDKLENFVEKGLYNRSDNFNIFLTNNVKYMKESLSQNQNWFQSSDERNDVYEYLYDGMKIPIDKTLSDIFYFSKRGNDSWADNTFDKIGLIGANMFGKQELDENGEEIGEWKIHDEYQRSTKIARYLREKQNLNNININKDFIVNNLKFPNNQYNENNIDLENIETDNTIGIATHSDTTRLETDIDTSWFAFSGFQKYVHGLSINNDSILYKRLVNLESQQIFNDLYDNINRKNTLFHALQTYSLAGAVVGAEGKETENIVIERVSGDSTSLIVTTPKVTVANWPGIFWGYMVEMLDMKNSITYNEDEEITSYGTKTFRSNFLPSLPDGLLEGGTSMELTNVTGESGVAQSDDLTKEQMMDNILKRINGIMSPEDNEYRNNWLISTTNGFLYKIHKQVTGSEVGGVDSVSNQNGYSSISGYVNTPSLRELSFTHWFFEHYMQIYMISMIFISVIVLFMVLLRMRSVKDGIIITLIMTVALLLPNILVENTVNIGNEGINSLYSNKFDFWAIVQHQQSVNRLSGAEATGDNLEKLVEMNNEKALDVYSQDAGVRIKWMAPKKTGVFTKLFNSGYTSDNLATNLQIFKFLFSSFVFEQEFEGSDPMATYLYRPYNAIARDANEFYQYLKTKNIQVKNKTLTFENNDETMQRQVKIPQSILETLKSSEDYANLHDDKFIGSSVWFDKSLLTEDNVFDIFVEEERQKEIAEKFGQFPNYQSDIDANKRSMSVWGMGSNIVNDVVFSTGEIPLSENAGIPIEIDNIMENNTDPHLVAFYKNTESPFYFFYNTLKARYGEEQSFKDSLLELNVFETTNVETNTRNQNGNGKVRDFLDMEGLFTNVIPYMNVANNYVYDWTSIHGTDVPTYDFNREGDQANEEYQRLKDKKRNMEKVWMMYTPWVDQLQNLSYKNERVEIGGSKVNIQNTLNPSYYLKSGRQMIFSEADMFIKGYELNNLTTTERRIQTVLDETYKDMMYLVNYYDMNDEVLLQAAATYATFNFNKEFSETKLIGENIVLYPQNFEMKNFNYDAFMRMIMLNATGEPIFSDEGLYQRILQKTSPITGILLVIADILAVIIVPTMKLIILLMVLFLGISLCITAVVNPPKRLIKILVNTILLPSLSFMVVNLIFAWGISLFLGDGITSYVGARSVSVATNDPTVTLVVIIFLTGIYIVMLFKIAKLLFEHIQKYGLGSITAGAGIIIGGLKNATKKVTGKVSQGVGVVGGAAVGGALAGKGNRLSGALDGGLTKKDGQSVFRQHMRDKRRAETTAKVVNGSKKSIENETKIKSKIDEKTSQKGNGNNSVEEKTTTTNFEDTNNAKNDGNSNINNTNDNTIVGNALGKTLATKHKVSGDLEVAQKKLSNKLKELNVNAKVKQHQTKETLNDLKEKGSKIQEQDFDETIDNTKSKIKEVINKTKTSPKRYAQKSIEQAKEIELKAIEEKTDRLNKVTEEGIDSVEKEVERRIKDIRKNGEK